MEAAMHVPHDAKKGVFPAALAEKGTAAHAASEAGIARSTAYKWREEDPGFADAWQRAVDVAVERIEAVLL